MLDGLWVLDMLKIAPLLALIVFLPAVAASIHAEESQTDDLADAHAKITRYMQAQSDAILTHSSPQRQQPDIADELPVFMSFVNRTSNELVIGLDRNATGTAEQYMEKIRQITNGSAIPVRLVSGYFVEESCDAVNDRCDPLIGGIEVSVNVHPSIPKFPVGPITIPVVNNNGDLGFVMSGHVAGTRLNVGIFQPNENHLNHIGVGNVITNPTNARSSDSAFVRTLDNIALEQKIFNPDGDPYDVVGTRTSEVHDIVYMAGIINKTINGKNYTTTSGGVLSTGVTIDSQIYGTLTNQNVASYLSASGDSGAPVYSLDSGDGVLLHGIHVGKSCFSDFPPTIQIPYVCEYPWTVYSPWEHVQSELNLRPIVGGEIFDLLGIYYARPDLQAAYPEAASGDMAGLIGWAWQYGTVDYPNDPNGPHAVLGPHAHTYALMHIWNQRPDLQAAYPEAASGDMAGLIGWAWQYGTVDYPNDPNGPHAVLGPHAHTYALITIYDVRPDLRTAYPEAVAGDRAALTVWARDWGISDYPNDPNGPHAVLGPHAHTYALITIYDVRPDLRTAYPEAVAGDHAGLSKWARDHGVTAYPSILGPYAGSY